MIKVGQIYNPSSEDTVADLAKPIRVATLMPEPPNSVYFVIGSSQEPAADDNIPQVNLDVVQYVRLDRLPKPLYDLVKDLLDVKQ